MSFDFFVQDGIFFVIYGKHWQKTNFILLMHLPKAQNFNVNFDSIFF